MWELTITEFIKQEDASYKENLLHVLTTDKKQDIIDFLSTYRFSISISTEFYQTGVITYNSNYFTSFTTKRGLQQTRNAYTNLLISNLS